MGDSEESYFNLKQKPVKPLSECSLLNQPASIDPTAPLPSLTQLLTNEQSKSQLLSNHPAATTTTNANAPAADTVAAVAAATAAMAMVSQPQVQPPSLFFSHNNDYAGLSQPATSSSSAAAAALLTQPAPTVVPNELTIDANEQAQAEAAFVAAATGTDFFPTTASLPMLMNNQPYPPTMVPLDATMYPTGAGHIPGMVTAPNPMMSKDNHSNYHHGINEAGRMRRASESSSASDKIYSFVAIPGSHPRKRPRRRYDEIERLYHCKYPNCAKSYGTLNHLNAHISMQKHGPKRHPSEFKEMRKEWRRQKKEREAARKAAEEAMRHQQMMPAPPPFPQPLPQTYLPHYQQIPISMALNGFI
ncbi:uncharacterized protein BYT42DRAFT_572559 [Radiomyces spectabilis]|uniref:uncharacterized protein n=1 Tax=Radiomyces spectabilis TaxID=64574 RepID=UPI002220D4B8|nr:uncharacterized protein BYT42DRAFT_572559 [Radiomyces spectabilis]KAI8378054.1 hypothetical protein BYT42DRAFT_572559 [Radiomyces spectabilis]